MAAGVSIYSELSIESARETVLSLFDSITEVLTEADREGSPTAEVAERIGRDRMAAAL